MTELLPDLVVHAPVTWRPVTSSNVGEVAYVPATRDLVVRFHSGLYVYENVPPGLYHGLLAAPSIGKYLNTEIKPHFLVRKIQRVRSVSTLVVQVAETVRVRESGAVHCVHQAPTATGRPPRQHRHSP